MAARYVICPFYKSQGQLVIKCEGISKRKLTNICFQTPEERTEYRKAHCESFEYEKNCDVCRSLLEKYYKPEERI